MFMSAFVIFRGKFVAGGNVRCPAVGRDPRGFRARSQLGLVSPRASEGDHARQDQGGPSAERRGIRLLSVGGTNPGKKDYILVSLNLRLFTSNFP